MSTETKETPVENSTGVLTVGDKSAGKINYTHFGKSVRLGSRKVQLVQVPKFSLMPKGQEAASIRSEQTKKVGSEWKKGTRDIIKGLSDEEELVYLPKLIGISPTSSEWNEKVLTFWADFGIEVPYGDRGVELEVGFKEVAGKVTPISLDGYIKYNFCVENSMVATTDSEVANTFHFDFVLVDKAKVAIEEEEKFAIKKKVDRMYLKLITSTDQSDKNKIEWIIETVGGEDGTGVSTLSMSQVQQEMEIERIKDRDLVKFQKIMEDTHLETKALIRKSVERGTIIQEGNSYFLDSKVIGASIKEAVGYLESAANQKDKLIIIERNKSIVA